MIFQSIKEYVCIRLLAHKNVLFATIITKGQSYCLVTRSTKQTVHCSRVSAERTLSSKNEGPRFTPLFTQLLSAASLSVSEYLLVSTSTFEVFEKTAQNHKKSPFVTNTTHTTI